MAEIKQQKYGKTVKDNGEGIKIKINLKNLK